MESSIELIKQELLNDMYNTRLRAKTVKSSASTSSTSATSVSGSKRSAEPLEQQKTKAAKIDTLTGTGFKTDFSFDDRSDLAVSIKRIEHITPNPSEELIPITNSASIRCSTVGDRLILPKLYAALSYLTGPGDDNYDDYKGSYSFMFELEVNKSGAISQYYYHIYHYRSHHNINFWHRVENSSQRTRTSGAYRQPDDSLFSDDDMCYFNNYFWKHALKQFESAKCNPVPFLKASCSNGILFGYLGGEYFLKCIHGDRYIEAAKTFESQLNYELALIEKAKEEGKIESMVKSLPGIMNGISMKLPHESLVQLFTILGEEQITLLEECISVNPDCSVDTLVELLGYNQPNLTE